MLPSSEEEKMAANVCPGAPQIEFFTKEHVAVTLRNSQPCIPHFEAAIGIMHGDTVDRYCVEMHAHYNLR